MQNPIGMKVMNAGEDLVQQRFDHSPCAIDRFFTLLGRAVEFDDVLQKPNDRVDDEEKKKRKTPYPKIVFCEIEEEINTPIAMRKKDALQSYHIDMFQFTQ